MVGTTISQYKILEGEPNWVALPDTTPLRIKELLQDCLQKEVHNRVPSDFARQWMKLRWTLKQLKASLFQNSDPFYLHQVVRGG